MADIFSLAFIALFLIGLAFSILLLSKDLGVQIKLADAICQSGGEATNCSAMTGSKGGKLFGLISWSEIGVVYFATTSVYCLLFGTDLIVALLAIIPAPYIVYSLWYQWRIVRKWCPLCLGVQAVFLIQAVVAIVLYQQTHPSFDFLHIGLMCLVGLLIVSLLFTLEPIIDRVVKYPITIGNFTAFRHLPEVKDALIYNRSYDMSQVNQLLINPEEARNIVTFVFSSFCGPCLARILGILNVVSKLDVGLRVIMPLKKPDDDTKELAVINYFISQYLESPAKFSDLLTRYPAEHVGIKKKYTTLESPLSQTVSEIIYSHYRWFYENELTGTPVIFYNDRKLPPIYSTSDLETIIIDSQG